MGKHETGYATGLAVPYPNIAQRRDALDLLSSLPVACTPLVFFDPQHRANLDKLKYGNEGARQRGRAKLPAMSASYIDKVCIEIGRVLKPSGYLMLWVNAFGLCEGHHLDLRITKTKVVKAVDLIAWDCLRFGNGYRARRRGDYLIILQKPPIKAKSTWRDHGIADRWPEKVDKKLQKLHPHIKPVGLISRLIGAVTASSDLVIDPAAGSFIVMHAARQLGRNFCGCDLIPPKETLL